MENTTGSSNDSENELDPKDFIDITEYLELDLDEERRPHVD